MKRVWVSLFGALLATSMCHANIAPPTPDKMTINTNAFSNNMAIPVLYTCDGKDISPQLSWTKTSNKTSTYAIIMKDLDAPGGIFYHWGIYNIPAATTSLAAGAATPTGANVAENNFNKAGYNGPCPPKGSAHTYVFTVYALDTQIKLANTASDQDLENALQGHILAQAEFRGVYSRWNQ